MLPPEPVVDEEDDTSIKVAIVGKPNAGKSSLLNKLAGAQRSIVSNIPPGTTRDAIDTKLSQDEQEYTLIDTAGIRKRGSIEPGVEKYSVLRAMQAIERCDVAVLVVDAVSGITAQDTHIAGYIKDAWKSVMVVINKWDLIEKDHLTALEFEKHIRQELNFLPYVPILFISAETGQRVHQVLPLVKEIQEERTRKITTAQLNKILVTAQDRHQSPLRYRQTSAHLLWHAGQDRAADLSALCQRPPRFGPFHLSALFGKPDSRNLPFQRHTHPDRLKEA